MCDQHFVLRQQEIKHTNITCDTLTEDCIRSVGQDCLDISFMVN